MRRRFRWKRIRSRGATEYGQAAREAVKSAARSAGRRSVKKPGPDHPITVEPAPETVTVVFNGKTVARSSRALKMQEARYAPVYYIPLADLDRAVMAKTAHRTYCPYKGDASYYTLTVGIESAENAVWAYEEPYEAVAAIAGHVAFYTDRVDSITAG